MTTIKLPTDVRITAHFEDGEAMVETWPIVYSISPDQLRAIAKACNRWAERRESGELPTFGELVD